MARGRAIRERTNSFAMTNGHTADRIHGDERTRIVVAVIVAALHQYTHGIDVAQPHIHSYGGVEVGQNRTAHRLIIKNFHIL